MLDQLKWLFAYDTLESKAPSVYRRVAFAAIVLYLVASAVLIFGSYVDNKPTVASTGLVGIHRTISLNFGGWFSEGIWWRGRQTPTPLPYTGLGILFYVVGYSPQRAMMFHSVLGGLTLWFLYKIAERRFTPESGLVCIFLGMTVPIFTYVTWSGWVVIWALAALTGAVNCLDLYVLTKRTPYYFAAAVLILCAGMSRPEYYLTGLIAAIFVPAPVYLRPVFVAVVFSFPIAAYIRNYVLLDTPPGLRILNDARKSMTWYAVLREWAINVQTTVIKKHVSLGGEALAIAAVIVYGVKRARFLAVLFAYFVAAFAGAYVTRRTSFNHEAYYFPHLMLATPLAAALLWRVADVSASPIRRHAARRGAAFALVVVAVGWNIYAIFPYFKTRVWFHLDDDVKQVRDYIRAHGGSAAPVALDYHADVTWLYAEIESNVPYPVWMYTSVAEKRPPINVARPDSTPEERATMGAWLRKGFEEWAVSAKPKYLVTPSSEFYANCVARRETRSIYTMFGLRNAVKQDPPIPMRIESAGGKEIEGTEVLRNGEFKIYEIKVP